MADSRSSCDRGRNRRRRCRGPLAANAVELAQVRGSSKFKTVDSPANEARRRQDERILDFDSAAEDGVPVQRDARYVDVRGGVQFDYEETRGTVILRTVPSDPKPGIVVRTFPTVNAGRSLDAEEFDHAKVLETRSREVVENGKEWLDIELTMQDIEADPAMRSVKRMEFRVDPKPSCRTR